MNKVTCENNCKNCILGMPFGFLTEDAIRKISVVFSVSLNSRVAVHCSRLRRKTDAVFRGQKTPCSSQTVFLWVLNCELNTGCSRHLRILQGREIPCLGFFLHLNNCVLSFFALKTTSAVAGSVVTPSNLANTFKIENLGENQRKLVVANEMKI